MGASAYAADIYSKGAGLKDAPEYVPVQTWTGFYIGGGGGYGSVNHDIKASYNRAKRVEDEEVNYALVEEGPSGLGARLNGIGGEGGFGTVQVGFDKQIGSKFVLGVFFDYDFSDINSKASLSFGRESGSIEATLTDQWYVGGRIGYLFNPSTLGYFLGGYTEATVEFPLGLKDRDLSGYFVGGGIETQLGGGWNVKLEYRYSEFDKETLFNSYGFKVTDELTAQSGRAVLTYKFGADPLPLK
jgi:outer membrane immunogenic protein